MGLGGHVERALAIVGVSGELVSRWVGAPCGCAERRDKLNSLGAWATRVVRGRVNRAAEYLAVMIGEDREEGFTADVRRPSDRVP